MEKNYELFLFIFFVCSVIPTLGNVHFLQQQFQQTGSLFDFDLTVIKNDECRDDMKHWNASLDAFQRSMTFQCAANDTECKRNQRNLSETNMFAAKQLDSFGHLPANLLSMNNIWQGSWEECLSVRSPSRPTYRGKFCWQKIATPITLEVAHLTSFSPEMCNSMALAQLLASWSTCMPRSCPDQDITAMFQSWNSRTSANGTMLTFCSNTCRRPEPPKKKVDFWVIIAIFVLVAALMLVGTTIDYVTDCCPNDSFKAFRKGLGVRCLLTFSMYSNGAELLTVEKRPGQIQCLHCMRVFSMTWVMVGHIVLQNSSADNPRQVLDSNRFFLNVVFMNAFFAVDTFLFLGGLLLTYLFLKDMYRKPSLLSSGAYWFLFYAHRIIRLSPPYWIFIGFCTVMYDFMTIGPTDLSLMAAMSGCRKTWWRNVLYINNLYDLENLCMGHAWYLAVDMQIHIFAPLFLIPLAVHIIGGIASGVLLIAVSTVLTYWAFYKWNFEASITGYLTHAISDLSQTLNFQQYVYFASWVRFTPFVIGGWTAYYLLYLKRRNLKLRLHWVIAVVLWICAFAVGIGCVYGLYDYLKGDKLSVLSRSSYNNWSRIAWSIALAWVVIACENGLAGPIKTFMEQGFWAPFSRLTYCAYLTHFFLISVIFGMSRQPMHFASTTYDYISGAIPLIVVSYAASFVWSCAFEYPTMKLEKMATSAVFASASRQRIQPADGNQTKPSQIDGFQNKKVEDSWNTGERANNNLKANGNGQLGNGDSGWGGPESTQSQPHIRTSSNQYRQEKMNGKSDGWESADLTERLTEQNFGNQKL